MGDKFDGLRLEASSVDLDVHYYEFIAICRPKSRSTDLAVLSIQLASQLLR